jgi:hypothetical protein
MCREGKIDYYFLAEFLVDTSTNSPDGRLRRLINVAEGII